MKLTEYLRDNGACSGIDEYEKYASAREAWEGSTSGSDLLWAVTTIDKGRGVRLAIELAKSMLKYVPKGEDRPAEVVEMAEGYLSGEVSRKDLIAASAAANAAAYAAANAAAYAAVAGAANAAYVANAAYAARAAASAAVAGAAYAAYAANAAYAARAAASAARAADRAGMDVAQWIRDRVNFSDLVDGLDIE